MGQFFKGINAFIFHFENKEKLYSGTNNKIGTRGKMEAKPSSKNYNPVDNEILQLKTENNNFTIVFRHFWQKERGSKEDMDLVLNRKSSKIFFFI